MAIELLPLLTDEGSPPLPGGEYVPPTATTSQEVADVTAEYLDYLNPDLRPSSLAYMGWLEGSMLHRSWQAFTRALGKAVDAGAETWSEFGNVVGTAIATMQLGIETVGSALGWSEGTPTVIERIDAITTAGGNSWWGTIPFDPTNPEWVLVGTDTFTDYIHFEEEGHVYIIDAIAPITARSEEIIDGEVVYFGLGWWAEMAGDYRGQRGYLDFEKSLAHRDGHLMRGCLVNFPKGGDGQISAYKYTPA